MALDDIDIPNLGELEAGVWTGGQPSAEQLRRAREAGLMSVISLCPPGEPGYDERAEAEKLGLAFAAVPVAAACDINDRSARALHEALERSPRPVLVHCGSGNRVGALVALKAHSLEGRSKDASIAHGRKAGLTSLEDAVSAMLGP